MKVLLHTCCAPCSVYCIDSLRAENIEPTLFWYNPNIHPFTEYKARRDCLKDYAKMVNVELILKEEYGLDEFCKNTIEQDICPICHGQIIEKTANDACQHIFCFTRILSWVRINNICPLCSKTIMKLNKI